MKQQFNFGIIWRHMTTSRHTRECEALTQRENARRESALREEFAQRTHVLEAQIAPLHAEIDRLRAENRALLNSVLGIAGIPPVIVADPPAPSIHGRHPEERSDEESLFVSPGCLNAQSKRDPSGGNGPQDDGPVDGSIAPSGLASPSSPRRTGHSDAAPLPNQTPLASTPLDTNAVPAQKQTRRARAAKDPNIIAPIRRRSWHQIYRMLEFESSHRKEREP